MRTTLSFFSIFAFFVVCPGLANAIPDATNSDLEIQSVRYDEHSGQITVDLCGNGASIGATYSFILEVDHKNDNFTFPAALAGHDSCVTTSWPSPLSSLSGQGGVPAGRYDLSVTLNRGDRPSFVIPINVIRSLPTAANLQFSDFDHGYINATAIYYMRNNKFADGYADNAFRPTTTINRAEFMKILQQVNMRRIREYEGEHPDEPLFEDSMCINAMSDEGRMPFKDVPKDAWYAPAVCHGSSQGLINGYPDGTFRPANPINFVEAAKIIANTFRLNASTTIPTCESADCPWFRNDVLMVEAHGAIPISITRFDQNITRGEMAEMIYRLGTHITDKPSQSYELLSFMQNCDEWIAAGGKNCE